MSSSRSTSFQWPCWSATANPLLSSEDWELTLSRRGVCTIKQLNPVDVFSRGYSTVSNTRYSPVCIFTRVMHSQPVIYYKPMVYSTITPNHVCVLTSCTMISHMYYDMFPSSAQYSKQQIPVTQIVSVFSQPDSTSSMYTYYTSLLNCTTASFCCFCCFICLFFLGEGCRGFVEHHALERLYTSEC